MEDKTIKTTLTLYCGLAGAGKSTHAREYATKSNARYISIDAFYEACFGDPKIHAHEFEVWMMFYNAIRLAGTDHVSVVIDTNAPTRANRDELYNWFAQYFDSTELMWIDASPALCMANNASRERVIPTDEFLDMVDAFEEPGAEDETRWDTIFRVENKHNKFSGCELVSKKQKKIGF